MGYCFMTIEKIKTPNAMRGKYLHNYREMEVPNADAEKAHLNEELVSLNGKTYLQAFNEKVKALGYGDKKGQRKIKSNQVRGFEVVTTFSREDREKMDIEKWKENNVKWLREAFNADPEKYGDNVLSVMYHGDETGNVHCHAFIVPIDDKGHLNARYYVQNREKLINLQNSYAELMEKEHGLKRGIPGSKATHKDIKRYYAALNNTLESELPKVKEHETAEEYRKRVNKLYVDLKLQNMGLEDKAKTAVLRYSQLILNAKNDAKKELYNKHKETLERVKDIEREYGSLEDCAINAEKLKMIELGASTTGEGNEYDDLFKRLYQMGLDEKKKRTPVFDFDR